jgi:MFS transporter, NNP family, nitrate/nitrite transporter
MGGMGGFVLPLAFGIMNDLAGIWTSCFMLLFGIGSVSLLWMHFAIRWQERRVAVPQSSQFRFLPELEPDSTEADRAADQMRVI